MIAFKGSPVGLLSCDLPTKDELPERTNPSAQEGTDQLRDTTRQCRIEKPATQYSAPEANATDSILNRKGWKSLTRYRKVRDHLHFHLRLVLSNDLQSGPIALFPGVHNKMNKRIEMGLSHVRVFLQVLCDVE